MIRQGTNIYKEQERNNLSYDSTLEQINFLDKRCYKRREGVYYPSVTTVLQYMPKNKFFETWMKDVGHNADRIMKQAGKEGTQVHEAAERLVMGERVDWMDEYGTAKYSQLVWEMIIKFHEFWTTHKPRLIYSEEFVYSDIDEFAGTMDLLVEMDGEIWLLDIKTSNNIHKSFDLQLSAYAKALEETKGIVVQRTGIIWLKAQTRKTSSKGGVYQGNGWKIIPVDNIEENYRLFKVVYELYKLENPKTEPIYYQYPVSLTI